MKETKHKKFKRIAGARTIKLLDMFELLGNCANTSNYEYSEKDIKKIFTALETSLTNTKELFLNPENQSKKFSL